MNKKYVLAYKNIKVSLKYFKLSTLLKLISELVTFKFHFHYQTTLYEYIIECTLRKLYT